MIKAFFDGACAPNNPGGTCGYGIVIYQDGEQICSDGKAYNPPLGVITTGNLGEYAGLFSILEYLIATARTQEEIVVCGDSRLVIEQMKGSWKIKKGAYKPMALKCQEMIKKFKNISFEWISREENYEADHLAEWGIKDYWEQQRDKKYA